VLASRTEKRRMRCASPKHTLRTAPALLPDETYFRVDRRHI
jgi:hypothetical protein